MLYSENGADPEWVFDTLREKSNPNSKSSEDISAVAAAKGPLNAIKQEVRSGRSLSNPETPKNKDPSPAAAQQKTNSSLKRNGATPSAPATQPAATATSDAKEAPKEKPKTENTLASSSGGSGSVSANSTRPSALTSVIYPVLSKVCGDFVW